MEIIEIIGSQLVGPDGSAVAVALLITAIIALDTFRAARGQQRIEDKQQQEQAGDEHDEATSDDGAAGPGSSRHSTPSSVPTSPVLAGFTRGVVGASAVWARLANDPRRSQAGT